MRKHHLVATLVCIVLLILSSTWAKSSVGKAHATKSIQCFPNCTPCFCAEGNWNMPINWYTTLWALIYIPDTKGSWPDFGTKWLLLVFPLSTVFDAAARKQTEFWSPAFARCFATLSRRRQPWWQRGVSVCACVCACVMHACRLGCSSGATHVVLHKQEDTAATARRLHNQRTFPSYSRRMIFLATCCQTVAFRWRGSKAPERSQLFQFVSISCFRIVLFRMCCSYLFGTFLSNSIKTIKVLIS